MKHDLKEKGEGGSEKKPANVRIAEGGLNFYFSFLFLFYFLFHFRSIFYF